MRKRLSKFWYGGGAIAILVSTFVAVAIIADRCDESLVGCAGRGDQVCILENAADWGGSFVPDISADQ